MQIAPSSYPVELVDELERLTREHQSPPPDESHSERDARQAKIDDIVAELKMFSSPRQGHIVANAQLVRIIGKGNFGVVWQGIHKDSGASRAVKIFDFDRLGLGLTLYHFRRGVHAMRHLAQEKERPESVIRLYDVENTALAFSMAYVEGHDLTNIASRGWSLSKKLDVFQSVCRAVSFAHDHGILHRDIKPANIVMDSSTVNRGLRTTAQSGI